MITLLGAPKYINMPVYNPIVYRFKSDLVGDPDVKGLRYYIKVKDGKTGDLMFSKTVMPAFSNGEAIVKLDKELSDFMTYNLHLSRYNSGAFDVDKSYISYVIEVSEEYFYEWDFTAYTVWVDPNTNISWAALIKDWTSGVETINFAQGDSVFVTFDNPNILNPEFKGAHTVKEVIITPSAGAIALDFQYDGNTYTQGGTVRFAVNKRIRTEVLYTSNPNCAFNGALGTAEFLNYDMREYEMNITSPNKGKIKVMSVLPEEYRVRPGNHLFVNFMKNKLDNNLLPDEVWFTTSQEYGTNTLQIPYTQYQWVQQMNFGPSRTNWGSGPATIITPATKWYTFRFFFKGQPISRLYKIFLDYDCPSDKIMEMLWLDKFGSFLPYNFTLKNEETQEVERSNFTKDLELIKGGGNTYEYQMTDGGEITYNAFYGKEFLLRTGLLNKEEAIFFQNVLHSPVTIVKVDGVYERCVIKTARMKILGNKQMGPRRYELVVALSNKNKINI